MILLSSEVSALRKSNEDIPNKNGVTYSDFLESLRGTLVDLLTCFPNFNACKIAIAVAWDNGEDPEKWLTKILKEKNNAR